MKQTQTPLNEQFCCCSRDSYSRRAVAWGGWCGARHGGNALAAGLEVVVMASNRNLLHNSQGQLWLCHSSCNPYFLWNCHSLQETQGCQLPVFAGWQIPHRCSSSFPSGNSGVRATAAAVSWVWQSPTHLLTWAGLVLPLEPSKSFCTHA